MTRELIASLPSEVEESEFFVIADVLQTVLQADIRRNQSSSHLSAKTTEGLKVYKHQGEV